MLVIFRRTVFLEFFLENECLCKPAVFLAKIQFNYANHFYNNGLSCYAVYSFQKYIQSFVSAFPIFQHYILRNAGRNRLQWCWWNMLVKKSMLVKNFLYVGEDRNLTHIGKSRKQNPKIGCVTERHFRKQNPRKFRKICFGCVTERHFWKQNPDKNPEYLVIS